DLTARMQDLERQAAERDAVAKDALAKLDSIEQRETELIAREAELHRLEATARRAAEEARKPEVDELAERRLKQRDDELSARESALNKAEQAILASRSRYEGKEKGLDEREKVLASRARELEERDAALNLREAQMEAELVDRFSRYVYAISVQAFRLPDADAEDVFQEVFARAYEHLDGLRDDAAVRPWLAQLTRRLCIDRLRATSRERPTADEDLELAGSEETMTMLEDALTVHEAVAATREHCRELLDRFFARDESYRT